MVATIGVDTVQSNRWSGVRRSSKEDILFFLKITQEQIKGKKMPKIFREKNIILENIVEVQRRKTSIFRKELVILQVLMIPSIFNPSLEMN